MTLEIKRNKNVTAIKVVGRLDSFTAPVLGKMIDQNSRTADKIVLELGGVEAISETGLQALLEARSKMQKSCTLSLVGVSESVMETFRINGCTEVLVIN